MKSLAILRNYWHLWTVIKGKNKCLDTCYSATYMSQTRDQKRFTISEVAADWHETVVPQRVMWPSIARTNGQLTHGAASRHTTAPISHTDHCSLYHYIIFWNLLPVMKHPIVVVSAIEWKWFANSIRLRLRQAQHLKTCCSRRADNGHGVEAISRNPGRNIDKPQPHSPPPCRQTSRRRRPTVGRVDTYRPNG